MIDLLDKSHAEKLMRMLGRAYGRIGEDGSRLHREQRQFISDAVDALASGERVVAVRLALFAELMKTRLWTRATLRNLSGIDRVVEQFLHESFDAQSAPRNQRLHRDAAHKLLGAMLPETGLIRAGSIELSVLADAAGYADNSDAMTDLIRVLDNKLKLITAVEMDAVTATKVAGAGKPTRRESRYQLTHDSLIPAIRRWLTKHQEGSIAGRAKRDLKARSQAWSDDRDDRQLPSLFEWMRFAALVRRRHRSEVEQRMMAFANRKYGRSIVVAITLLVAMTFAWRHWRNESYSDRLVSQLSIATTSQLPITLSEIDSYPDFFVTKLLRQVADESETEHVRFLSSLALPSDNQVAIGVVADYLLSAKLDLLNLARQRRPEWIDLCGSDWANALNDLALPAEERLRAGLLLAGRQTSATDMTENVDPAVKDHAAFLASSVVDESLSNKLAYANLLELAKPIRKTLTPELITISWDADQLHKQDASITLIRDLHADHPIDLIDAALDLQRTEFESIMATVDAGPLSITQIERFVSLPNSASRKAGRRIGRAIALGVVMATSDKTSTRMGDFDWSKRISDLVHTTHDSVETATLIHSLVPLGFDRDRLFDSVFDTDADLRCMQLFVMGEMLQSQGTNDNSFKNQCRSLGRDRFRSDPDPGVFSAARWLLVRLGEQSWIEDELEKRIQRVDSLDVESLPSGRLRINDQKIPMVRFPAGSIAAVSATDDAIPDSFSADVLPYEIEVATDEVTVEQYLRFDSSYFHGAELKSQDPKIPVGVVPWEQAVAYCQWLTLQDGMTESDFAYETNAEGDSVLRSDYPSRGGYRMPTAREWVAVWDADPARTACVMDDSLVEYYACIAPFSNQRPEPVGGTKPDRNGLFHLAGNSEEWCSDQVNQYRAIRGIFYGWGLDERHIIPKQHWFPGQINYVRIGFRVARSTARKLIPDRDDDLSLP